MKKIINLNLLHKCEMCENTGLLIENDGVMTGLIIPCPKCAINYHTFIGQYGKDEQEWKTVYIQDKELIEVNEKKDYLVTSKGELINLNKK